MRRLLRLFRRPSPPATPGSAWIDRLPLATPEERDEDAAAAREFARRLHGRLPSAPGISRRVQAVLHSARRRRVDELAEALRGLAPADAIRLAEAISARGGLDSEGLGSTASELLATAPTREPALAALALLSLSPLSARGPLLLRAALSALGAPLAARAAAALPDAGRWLSNIVEAAPDVGRALAIEEWVRALGPKLGAEEAAKLLRSAAEVSDPLDRAWAAVPLLEAVDVPALLEADPSLAEAVVLCLEANARGGWRGGPGPGLGRLPGSQRAAEALLEGSYAPAIRERTARAVLDAHPAPPTRLQRLAASTSEG